MPMSKEQFKAIKQIKAILQQHKEAAVNWDFWLSGLVEDTKTRFARETCRISSQIKRVPYYCQD